MAVTPEQIEQIRESAVGPHSVTGDAGSYTEPSAEDMERKLALADTLEALGGTNANSGARSPFNLFRPARASFPGAYR